MSGVAQQKGEQVADDSPTISYKVADLLDKISKDQAAGFARIHESLSNKADKADVASIKTDVGSLKERIGKIEERQNAERTASDTTAQHQRELAERHQRHWNIGLSVALIVVTALLAFIPALH